MPKPSKSVPKYRHHKATGQAIVTLGGRDHYLGRFGSKSSRMLYDRMVSEWLASNRSLPPREGYEFLIKDLIIRYWKFVKEEFKAKVTQRGKPNTTAERLRSCLRLLRNHYADLPAEEFGPVSLKALRQRMINELGWSRKNINGEVDRIRRMFKWAVSEELLDEAVYRRLQTVDGLRRGRSDAKEPAPVPPVDKSTVDATIAEMPQVVADMVRLARYCGMRPNEVCLIRPCDVERKGEVWMYVPESHKCEHHEIERSVPMGPNAQQVLLPYLDRAPEAYCFDPRETVEQVRQLRRDKRVTPANFGNRQGYSARTRSGQSRRDAPPSDRYTVDSFRRAIHRACDRAFPPPPPYARLDRETKKQRDARLTKAQREELQRWESAERWSPNQLRHSAATEIRERYGIEAVAAVLGHSRTDTSEIYALRNIQLAQQVAKELG
jgi:integrase